MSNMTAFDKDERIAALEAKLAIAEQAEKALERLSLKLGNPCITAPLWAYSCRCACGLRTGQTRGGDAGGGGGTEGIRNV